MKSFRARSAIGLSASDGFSLVEVLVGTALTTLVATVVGSLLFAAMTSERRLRQETNQYESLRLAFSMIMQDARFATGGAECHVSRYLRLYPGDSVANYVEYRFASADGTPDPNHLHRWVVEGGVVQRDDIVGWRLVPPYESRWLQPFGSQFICESGDGMAKAGAILVAQPIKGQDKGPRLEAVALPR